MSGDAKIGIGALAILAGLFLGYFSWYIWLLSLSLLIIILLVPTKKKPQAQDVTHSIPLARQAQTIERPAVEGLEHKLERRIAEEHDERVKQGLLIALEMVRSEARVASEDTYPIQATQALSTGQPLPPTLTDVPVLLTAEEQQAEKRRQELRNVNIILYTASFLLVGAAAAFISFSDVPDSFKFGGLTGLTVALYVVGLTLHALSTRLRPAATAFVGTGLALVPFVGLAFYYYVVPNAALSWWLTSIVGVVATVGALLRTRSLVIGYVLLASLFSLGTSTASVLEAPFVWYFVSVLVTASLLQLIALKSPSILPKRFADAMRQNAQLATPGALVISLLLFGAFTAADYAVISGLAALHYAVFSLGGPLVGERFWNSMTARGLFLVFTGTLTFALTETWWLPCLAMSVIAVVGHIYSVSKVARRPLEEIWLWTTPVVLLFALTGWYDEPDYIAATFLTMLAVSLHQVVVTKKLRFISFGALAAVVLPIVISLGIFNPSLSAVQTALVAFIPAVMLLGLRTQLSQSQFAYKYSVTVLYTVLLLVTGFVACFTGEAMSSGWLLFAVALAVYATSYVERTAWTLIGANTLAFFAVPLISWGVFGSSYVRDWSFPAAMTVLAIAWYIYRWGLEDNLAPIARQRREIMTISTIVALALGAIVGMSTMSAAIGGVLLGFATAAALAFEAYTRKWTWLYELAVYAVTVSLVRLIGYVSPEADGLIYTHILAASGGVAAYLYKVQGKRDMAVVRGIIALSVLSLPTAFAALFDPSKYQLFFLFEHVTLIVAGFVLSRRIVLWWGAIGVGLALLYLLRGYGYLMLALIAVGLIGLAVWRLVKRG